MIIAEIGLNHLGSEKNAYYLLESLLKLEIEAITFQIREKAFYDGSKPHKIPLPEEFYSKTVKLCKKHHKKIGIAISDINMVDFFNELDIDFWKTLSWDILNYELQNKLQKTNKLVFLSTGISDYDDIITANNHFSNCCFIHTQLTHSINEANLKAIQLMKKYTGKNIAYGLHCNNSNVLYACISYEPSDIFFYVKPNESEKYPDDSHAILLDNVNAIVQNIKLIQTSLGDGKKIKMVKNL
ncbi:MAG: N-acetylneuraminate synthase family protein [archaeon]